MITQLQDSLARLTFHFDELEKAYEKLLNRDEFILDLLNQISDLEILIKNLQEDSKRQISSLISENEELRSRSFWQCICGK
jgi:hypothetical protein